MSANPHDETAGALLAAARAAEALIARHGADAAKVATSRSRGVEVEWRDGRLERVRERTTRSLGMELYVDGRYSSHSTNDLRSEALDTFVRDAVAMTRMLEPDAHRALPDPARYLGRAEVDLDLFDPEYDAVTGEARRRIVAELEALVRQKAAHLPVISITAEYSDGAGQSARIHTNGFEGVRVGTNSALSAMITIQDKDGRRPMGWDYSSQRHRGDLDPIEALATEAVARAEAQLGAGKLPTGRYTVVVDRRAVGRLLGALLGPLSGPALQQKRSLWDGRLGDRIASPLLTIIDAPHSPRGHGSALWDADGFATRRRPIIESGVLSTYLIDDYYARKLGVEPTSGATHNFEWALGEKSLPGLVADVGEGVYLDRFLGGNSNSTTGEISLGCAGRVIRGGQLAEPVSEVNLAGHFGQIWENLVAVGADSDRNSAAACPTCVFQDVQLSGS